MIGIDAIAGPNTSSHPMGEVRAVDNHQGIGTGIRHRVRRLRISRRIFGNCLTTAVKPDDRQLFDRK